MEFNNSVKERVTLFLTSHAHFFLEDTHGFIARVPQGTGENSYWRVDLNLRGKLKNFLGHKNLILHFFEYLCLAPKIKKYIVEAKYQICFQIVWPGVFQLKLCNALRDFVRSLEGFILTFSFSLFRWTM